MEGTNNENVKTRKAVMLPSMLNSLADKWNTELKKRFTNGIVRPAPIDIIINGDKALIITIQSYSLYSEKTVESYWILSGAFSVILSAKIIAEIPRIVIIQRIFRSLKYIIQLPNE